MRCSRGGTATTRSGFFLTAGFLGVIYYFVPKRAERPIYSYRLSIIHFWSLIFVSIWTGPRSLHFTALPGWTQTLAITFSIMLWMASWAGMINALLTLSGAWDKLRTDPVLRMLVVSVAFYGMSTFEDAAMSIRSVDSLARYTDWTDGAVHSGALGWIAFASFGAIYCLVPWLWNKRELYSPRLVSWHFWIATLGIVLYITSMWVAGILQGLMWRSYTPQGALAVLVHRNRRGDASLLSHPRDRRRAVPHRLLPDALQRRHDDHGVGAGGARRPADASAGGMRGANP